MIGSRNHGGRSACPRNGLIVVFLLLGLSPSVALSQVEYDAKLLVNDIMSPRGGFAILYEAQSARVGELFQLDVAIRAPSHAKEIIQFNEHSPGSPHQLNVHCKPFASFATIEEIEFVAIENLPNGIKATTNAKGLKAAAGQIVALQFSGRPTEPGLYALVLRLKARASVMGIPGPSAYCEVTGATIRIE